MKYILISIILFSIIPFSIKANSDTTNVNLSKYEVKCKDLRLKLRRSSYTLYQDSTLTTNVAAYASGGTKPYLYSLDNIGYSRNMLFENLPTGKWCVFVMDANGCRYVSKIKLDNVIR